MELPQKLQKEFEEIKTDCLELEEEGFLTEYGEGQMDLIKIIE